MKTIIIHKNDNVAVALSELKRGDKTETGIIAADDIPAGHKIAAAEIREGEAVIKYGAKIGYAKTRINAGEHVHVHNLRTSLGGKLEYEYEKDIDFNPQEPPVKTFSGFRRSNGKAGVRNEIWIIPTVGCVNGIVKALEKKGRELIRGSINAVVGLTHPYGCSQLGGDKDNTEKILANLIKHPNAGGVLVVGLGCENSGINAIKELLGEYNRNRIKFLQAQDCDDEIDEGGKLLTELIETAANDTRVEIPIGELIAGLKCGGSDGLSGITANPAVGVFSDMIVSAGGTAILTEVPEMFGAETLLMNRAVDEAVFSETVRLINDFKDYFEQAGVPVYENPSPGNKAGGISTLEDKSLGCTQKSGSSAVCGVIGYGGAVTSKGLNLLYAPGNDLVAATALAAAGAQIVLFTTGRGTPFACPVPTIKISSNTALSLKKSNWIDFNAGAAATGKGIDEIGEELFKYVIEVVSGKLVKSEEAGYNEMAIFKTGVTL